MNPWQMAQQIKHKLATVTWADGAQDVVFGPRSVLVYGGGSPTSEQHMPQFPFALVTIDSATPDDTHPDLIVQQFSVTTCVQVSGDAWGEHAIIGSSRANLGKSAGAGVAEVSERVRFALQSLTGFDGAHLLVTGSGSSAPSTVGGAMQMAFESYTVTALCTSQPFYAAPQQVNYSGTVWSWSGDQCSSRYDFRQYRLAYRASPTTPSETPTGMTIAYSGTATSWDVGVSLAGLYTVFAEYDSRGTGATTAFSSGLEVGSYRVRP